MYQPERIFGSRDFLIALLAIYVAMTLAGLAAGFGPAGLTTAVASLAGAAGLIFWFAAGAKRGRAIDFPVYFLAIVAFPVIFVVFVVGLVMLADRSGGWMWTPVFILSAAANIGFQLRAGPDAPLFAYIWYCVPNMLVLGFVALAARGALTALRSD